MLKLYTIIFFAIIFSSCSNGRKKYVVNKYVVPERAQQTSGLNAPFRQKQTPEQVYNTKYVTYYDSTKEILNNPASIPIHVVETDTHEPACDYSFGAFLSVHQGMQGFINNKRKKEAVSKSDWRSNYNYILNKIRSKDAGIISEIILHYNANIKANPNCPEIALPGLLRINFEVVVSRLNLADTIFEGFKITQEDGKIFCFPCETGVDNQFYYGIWQKKLEKNTTPEQKETKNENPVNPKVETPIAAEYSSIVFDESKKELCKLTFEDFKLIQQNIINWGAEQTKVPANEYAKLGMTIDSLMYNKFEGPNPDIEAKYKLIEAVNTFFAVTKPELKCPLIYSPDTDKYLVKFNALYTTKDDTKNFVGIKFYGDEVSTIYCLPCSESKDSKNRFVFGIYKQNTPNDNEEVETDVTQKKPLSIHYPKSSFEFEKGEEAFMRTYKLDTDNQLLMTGSKFKIENITFSKKTLDQKITNDFTVTIEFQDSDGANDATIDPIVLVANASIPSTDYLPECAAEANKNRYPEYLEWSIDFSKSELGYFKEIFGDITSKPLKFKFDDLRTPTILKVSYGDNKSESLAASITEWWNPGCIP